MPNEAMNLDCCTLLSSQDLGNVFLLDLGNHRAAYVRFYNPETGLNHLEYIHLDTAERCVLNIDADVLCCYDQSIRQAAPYRTLSKDDLAAIYQMTRHVHVLPATRHPSQALIRTRHKGERLSNYDESVLQHYERSTLMFSQKAAHHPQNRSFSMRLILIDLAIKSTNHKSLYECLFICLENVTHEEACQLLNKAVSSCIANRKRDMLVSVVKVILQSFWDKRPDYDDLLHNFEKIVSQILSDQAAFERVKPIFALLGQLYTDVRELRFVLGKSSYRRVREFHSAMEKQLIAFVVNIFKPIQSDFCPVQAFVKNGMAELAALERVVPSADFLNLPGDRQIYQGFHELFKKLSQQKSASFESLYSFFGCDTSHPSTAASSDHSPSPYQEV